MSWKKLLAENRVAEEPSDRDEIAKLRELAHRNLRDAAVEELSDDGRFDCAYSAARAFSMMVIRACGYRVKQPAAHYNTFRALEVADRKVFEDFAIYFDACRRLRNELSYDEPEVVSASGLAELNERVGQFETIVNKWLESNQRDIR